MPKIVCVQCEIQYRPHENGVYLVEMAWKPPQPYKIWHSDVWICPNCKNQVVSGFADHPLSEHYQDNFDCLLNSIDDAVVDGKATVIYEYERVNRD